LIQYGTPEQKKRFLEPLARGEIRSCFFHDRARSAQCSNPTWLDTTAVKDGDHYVINGRKWFTTAADGAGVRDRDGGDQPRRSCPHARQSDPGPRRHARLQVVRNIGVMGHEGDDWRATPRCPTRTAGCQSATCWAARAPASSSRRSAWARVAFPPLHALDRHRRAELRAHVQARRLARARPRQAASATKQTVQTWIAESRAEIDAARLLVLHAAWKVDTVGHARRPRGHLVHQVLRGQGHARGGGSGDPGARRRWASPTRRRSPCFYTIPAERAARIYDGPDEVHKSLVARKDPGALRDAGEAGGRVTALDQRGDAPRRRGARRGRRLGDYLRATLGLGGPPVGRTVSEGPLQPHLPGDGGRHRAGGAPSALREQGEDRARHGS